MHQEMCTTRKPFQRLGGLLSNHPDQTQKKNRLSNEKVHCRKVSATFSRSLKCNKFQGKRKNAIFSWTVFANGKTHLAPTLNTCKVGAWRAVLTTIHSLLFSAHRLVHDGLLVHVRCPLTSRSCVFACESNWCLEMQLQQTLENSGKELFPLAVVLLQELGDISAMKRIFICEKPRKLHSPKSFQHLSSSPRKQKIGVNNLLAQNLRLERNADNLGHDF